MEKIPNTAQTTFLHENWKSVTYIIIGCIFSIIVSTAGDKNQLISQLSEDFTKKYMERKGLELKNVSLISDGVRFLVEYDNQEWYISCSIKGENLETCGRWIRKDYADMEAK